MHSQLLLSHGHWNYTNAISGDRRAQSAKFAMYSRINLRQDGEQLEQAGKRGRLGVAAEALHEPLQAATGAPLLRRHVRDQRCHRQAQLCSHGRRPTAKVQQELHQRIAQAGRCVFRQLLKVPLHLHSAISWVSILRQGFVN